MKLIVGLDVSSEKLAACLLTDDPTMPILKKDTFSNSLLGASKINYIELRLPYP